MALRMEESNRNMKSIICLFIICIITLFNSRCAHAQNDIRNKQPEIMLNEFYTARSTMKLTVRDHHRLDSLQSKYCTVKFRNELKADFQADGLDHDILTMDNGIDAEALKTISVKKDPTKVNDYIVSYFVSDADPSNKLIKKKVTIRLTVVNEKEYFKIDSVK